jgi:hypothetical protein
MKEEIMSVLLVWNCIETLDYYLLPDMVEDNGQLNPKLKILEDVDGCYINDCGNTGKQDRLLNLVSNAVSHPDNLMPEKDTSWNSIWTEYKVELKDLKEVDISHVYECGWLI